MRSLWQRQIWRNTRTSGPQVWTVKEHALRRSFREHLLVLVGVLGCFSYIYGWIVMSRLLIGNIMHSFNRETMTTHKAHKARAAHSIYVLLSNSYIRLEYLLMSSNRFMTAVGEQKLPTICQNVL